jgi:hypothetical protein
LHVWTGLTFRHPAHRFLAARFTAGRFGVRAFAFAAFVRACAGGGGVRSNADTASSKLTPSGGSNPVRSRFAVVTARLRIAVIQ